MSLTAERTIPCRLCGRPTPMLGTKLCNPCWETDRAVTSNPDLARRILAGMAPPMTTPTNEEVRRQFEAWASGDGSFQYVLERNKDGEYTNEVTYRYWLAYQAALRGPAVVALVEASKAVAPYVASEVLEHCDGNKCREPWCAGCMGEEHAGASVEKARDASSKLYAALAPFTTGAGHE